MNEFVIKNGLIVNGDTSTISGSLIAPSITGSLQGTASYTSLAALATSVYTPSGTANRILYQSAGGAGSTTSTSANLAWNGTTLAVNGSISFGYTGTLFSSNGAGNNISLHDGTYGIMKLRTNSVDKIIIYYGSSGDILLNSTGSTGNVGIGTTSPTYKLDVSGSARITDGLTITGSLIAPSITGSLLGTASYVNVAALGGFIQGGNSFGTTGLLGTNDNQSLAIETNGTTKMFVSSSGNVGVGTTTPSQKLEINGNIKLNTNGYFYSNTDNIIAGQDIFGNYLFAGTNSASTPANLFIGRMNTTTIFQTDSGNERMRIASGGNVGIGTTTPTSPLHILKSGGARINLGDSQNTVALGSIEEAGDSAIGFYTQTTTERMRINSAGNVGIGQTSPVNKLDIYDTNTSATATSLRTYGTNTGNKWSGRIVAGGTNVAFLMGEYNAMAWLGAHNAALNAWSDFYINPDGTTKLFLGGNGGYVGGPIMTIDNNTGRVGIGTTSPSYKLDVSGSARITTGLTVTGSFTANSYFREDKSTALQESLSSTTVSSSLEAGGDIIVAVLDGSVVKYDLVYLDTTGTWYTVDNGTDVCTKLLGIALSDSKVLLDGHIACYANNFTTGTGFAIRNPDLGAPIYIPDSTSATPGTGTRAVPTTTGDYVRILGHTYYRNTTVDNNYLAFRFKPSNDWVEL